jgi:hypothetical protein
MGIVDELAVVKAQASATVIVLLVNRFNRRHQNLSRKSFGDDTHIFQAEAISLF